MSNIIKSHYISLNQGGKRVIDSDSKLSRFKPIYPEQVNVIEKEGQEYQEENSQLDLEITTEKAQKIIENAKIEAEEIISIAKKEAFDMKERVLEEAREKGYQDGMKESLAFTAQKELEFQEKENLLQKNYEEQMERIEPEIAELLISLIGKISGVIMEDNKEIILYLIKSSMKNLGRCENFRIRVSKEDAPLVNENINILYDTNPDIARIEVFEEESFRKNQCIIETDFKMIDCSIDVQIKNLSEAIKLLSLQ